MLVYINDAPQTLAVNLCKIMGICDAFTAMATRENMSGFYFILSGHTAQ